MLVDFWARENPHLDAQVKALGIRLRRAAHHLERALRRELGQNDTDVWELEVLMALRRGAGHCLSAGELLKESQVTSGAITNRVARLEERGWARRDVDPSDRRHVLVTLTPEGVARADKLLATKTQADQAVLGLLAPRVQERLNNDLRALLIAIEGPAGVDVVPVKHRRGDTAP
jgi:DNA-binding MarR family transcriptional regulator